MATKAQVEAAKKVLAEGRGIGAAIDAADRAAWEKIENAPKDGTWIVMFFPEVYESNGISIRSWQKGTWNGCEYEAWVDCFMQIKPTKIPTHWRPLPEPPEKESEE